MLIRRNLVRERALALLDRFSIKKAPVDVELIAQRLGIVVVREPADDELSGFLLRDPGRKTSILGVNEKHPPNRQRFTIAHECGHFLLHEGEVLHVDKQWSGYQIRLRDGQSSAGTDVEEIEANLFAAELLMPLRFLDADLEKLAPISLSDEKRIKGFARQYKVSEQALALRLTYLGYIQQ